MIGDVRAVLVGMQDHPLAVALLILLAGIHAAVWCVVFERLGYPPRVAALLLLPPLTLFMPLVLVAARWPAPERARATTRFRRTSTPQVRRLVQRARPSGAPQPQFFEGRRSSILASDGLPRRRISLGPSHEDTLFRPLGDVSGFPQPQAMGSVEQEVEQSLRRMGLQ